MPVLAGVTRKHGTELRKNEMKCAHQVPIQDACPACEKQYPSRTVVIEVGRKELIVERLKDLKKMLLTIPQALDYYEAIDEAIDLIEPPRA